MKIIYFGSGIYTLPIIKMLKKHEFQLVVATENEQIEDEFEEMKIQTTGRDWVTIATVIMGSEQIYWTPDSENKSKTILAIRSGLPGISPFIKKLTSSEMWKGMKPYERKNLEGMYFNAGQTIFDILFQGGIITKSGRVFSRNLDEYSMPYNLRSLIERSEVAYLTNGNLAQKYGVKLDLTYSESIICLVDLGLARHLHVEADERIIARDHNQVIDLNPLVEAFKNAFDIEMFRKDTASTYTPITGDVFVEQTLATAARVWGYVKPPYDSSMKL